MRRVLEFFLISGMVLGSALGAQEENGVLVLDVYCVNVPSDRVLGTSARKPPLSDTLLWVTLSLAHPFEIEVILSKR